MSQPVEREPFKVFQRVEARRLLYRLQNELEFKLFLKETAEKKMIDCDELDFLDATGDVNLTKLKKTIKKKQSTEGRNRYQKRNITKTHYGEFKESGDDEYLFGRVFAHKTDDNNLKKRSLKVDVLPSSEVRRDLGFEERQLQSSEFMDLTSADCSEEGKCGSLNEDKERPHRCSQCNKTFHWKSSFSQHMRIHTGEKPYECYVCGMKFNQLGSCKDHMRIHTGERPYACSVCGLKFSRMKDRNVHMRIHTGEKPYECSVCGKRFSQISIRNRHMRVHTGEKLFGCSVCEKKFSRSSYRNQHLNIHSGATPYECFVCGMSFRWSSYRNRHMKVHTGESP